jgi:sarcosine oxidase
MAATYDLIILGLGGVGSAAALSASRRGLRVLGLEQFTPVHSLGSTHGQTRAIRKAYFEHPDYVPLLNAAYASWSRLESECGERLFERVGILQVGHPDGEVCRGVLHSARRHQLEVETLTPAECRQQFPSIHLSDDEMAVLERDAGFLYVEKAVHAHLALAGAGGADLRFEERVCDWQLSDRQVTITTDRGTYHAPRLAIAAGAWAGRLVPSLTSHLRVLRKHLHWFHCQDVAMAMPHLPVFFFESLGGHFYGFPCLPTLGFKVAEHTGGTPLDDPQSDPQSDLRQLDPVDLNRIETFLGTRFPRTKFEHRQHSVCFYTTSPDHHFIVDRDPQHDAVSFVAGLSGHGYKFAPALGDILVDLAIDGSSKHPIEFLSLNRFRPQ